MIEESLQVQDKTLFDHKSKHKDALLAFEEIFSNLQRVVDRQKLLTDQVGLARESADFNQRKLIFLE